VDISAPKFYTARELAGMLGVSEQTVYQSVAGRKTVPMPRATRFGARLRFAGVHIIEFYRSLGIELPEVDRAPSSSSQEPGPPERRPRGRPRKVAVVRVTA
jgi:hypothetical protein